MISKYQIHYFWTFFVFFILLHSTTVRGQFGDNKREKEKKLVKSYAKNLSVKNKKVIKIYIQADNHFIRKQYLSSISLFKKAIEKEPKFVEAYMKLASIYLLIGDLSSSEELLTQMDNKIKHHPKAHRRYFYLGKIALEQENYKKALPYLKKYLDTKSNKKIKLSPIFKTKTKKYLQNISYALANMTQVLPYHPIPLSTNINRYPYQYFPTLSADEKTIVYTVLRGNSITQQEDIFIAHKNNDNQWEKGHSISSLINTSFNEGTCTLSANKKYLIFTICNGKKVIGRCDLFISENIGGNWMPPKNLGPNINTTAWESQPSISADGNTLYFSSDRPAGIGKKDIYTAKRLSDGSWDKAHNLGKIINTPEDDLAPFIHVNNSTLYFASKGHPGFGDFDLFKSELSVNNIDSESESESNKDVETVETVEVPKINIIDSDNLTWSIPENIGYPINNFQEQSGVYVNLKGDTAYFSHTSKNKLVAVRGGIFKLKLPPSKSVSIKSSYVFGKIKDAKTKSPLEAVINLYYLGEGKPIASTKSDPITGEYLIVISEGADYLLYITRPKYLFSDRKFSLTKELTSPVSMDILLTRIEEGKTRTLNNIFFESNSYELSAKSITELKRLFDLLKQNPKHTISIHGHTDNLGSQSDNLHLSLQRTKSVYNYLIKLGISPKQVNYKGFGELKPIASNNTEEGRLINRRIEFIIK